MKNQSQSSMKISNSVRKILNKITKELFFLKQKQKETWWTIIIKFKK